jgi:hypothetical protein
VSNWIYALPFGKESKLGGWQLGGILYARTGRALTIIAKPDCAVDGIRQPVASQANRPESADRQHLQLGQVDRSLVGSGRVPDRARAHGRPSATPAATSAAGPGYFNIDLNLIKITKFGRFEHELRAEVFNVLNHPAFADPNVHVRQLGLRHHHADAGHTRPAPTCGTTERQIQLSMKLRF